MLKGIDVSHHNNLAKILSIIDKPDFCIIKATEGKTYVDPMFHTNIRTCLNRRIPIGFYHYARPEFNDPIEECNHFMDNVSPYVGNAVFALDWEGDALEYPITWARDFMRHFYYTTKVRPLIYCSAWYTQRKEFKKLFDENFGLWVAQYTSKPTPQTGVYPFWAFWQYASPNHNYTGKPCVCDYDYFNGNLSQLKAYMKIL